MAERFDKAEMAVSPNQRPSQSTTDILRTLIGFSTVSRDSNMDLINWVHDYLASYGVTCRLSYNAEKTKANIFATIGEGSGGIALSGHTDVVPVDGQNWSTDPFKLIETDGRFYGRGTSDMKGFIAVVLSKVPAMVKAPLKEPIHLAFSFDEEVGCLGVRHLLDDIKESGIKPRGCIIGEPTSMKTIIGHKSGSVYTCKVNGLEVHSSLAPQGVNSIEFAAMMVLKIREIGLRLKETEKRHDGYEVPYSTMQTGVIEGGYASNIVPAECSFRFDIRSLPWTNPEEIVTELRTYAEEFILPEMREIHPNAAIEIVRKGGVPGFAIAEDAELTRYVQRVALSNTPPGYVTFGSEAGLFQEINIPAVICGPGSISQAHKADEFIDLTQLAACEAFIDRLIVTPFMTI
ncbi:acetylornithine deacetylase [Kordiimonas pumila]|uniref:Acetylornithine deacetylase n=1 Tax=Kordiimonas pumila TaxID=2161677 RepID=A0ABV7D6H1_9PROT|nr:acetylornithine deacetylase [Kordiimonas pumila]